MHFTIQENKNRNELEVVVQVLADLDRWRGMTLYPSLDCDNVKS